MDDEQEVRLEAFHLEEIQEMLEEEGHHVSLEQAQMIANFVQEVGGLDEALAILGELRQDRHAA
jgi:hypothetical protein